MFEGSPKKLRKRRLVFSLLFSVGLLLIGFYSSVAPEAGSDNSSTEVLSEQLVGGELALDVLDSLLVKGRAPKTGYSRSQFSSGWADLGDCDVRNLILARDLEDEVLGSDNCTVMSGVLNDPYTGAAIDFVRGVGTSGDVQIDHVVALSDAWQKGAQQLDGDTRLRFANDPLNLLAVDGSANQQKGDSDAASWLPPNKSYRCAYVARQIAVKRNYSLWVTDAEASAMRRVLSGCSGVYLPSESSPD